MNKSLIKLGYILNEFPVSEFVHRDVFNYEFQNESKFSDIFLNFSNFYHFSTFWKTEAVVNNQGLIELGS